MRQLFLDIETKQTFDQVGGYFPEKLGISFVGIIVREGFPETGTSVEKRYELFEKDFADLSSLLESADLIIGFNSAGFDLPAIQTVYPGNVNKLPQLDLLEVIKQTAGHRVSLDALAKETLGTHKAGSGLDAIRYYQEEKWAELAKYCMKDVEITRDIYDYGRVNKKIKFMNKWNNLVELSVDFSQPTSRGNSLQLTLL